MKTLMRIMYKQTNRYRCTIMPFKEAMLLQIKANEYWRVAVLE